MKSYVRHNFAVLVLALAFMAAAPSLMAAPLDSNGERLRKIFQTLLEDQKNYAQESGAIALVYEGELTVEKVEKYYAVTLPSIKIKGENGRLVDIGMFSVNAAPHEKNPKLWKMTIAAPTPVLFYDEKGKPDAELHIGAQNFSGIWHEDYAAFIKMNAGYKDIKLTGGKDKGSAFVPMVNISFDLNEDKEGRWSGPAAISFEDINMVSNTGSSLKIKNLKMKEFLDRIKLDLGREIEHALALQAPEETESAVLDRLVEILGTAANGFRLSYELNDLVLTSPDLSEIQQGPEKTTLSKALFDLDMKGFLENDVSLNLKLGSEDFVTESMPAQLEGIFPENFALDLAIEHIPFKDIIATGVSTSRGLATPTAAKAPETSQNEALSNAALPALFELPVLLSQAGTKLTLKKAFGNDAYDFTLDGTAMADSGAVNKVTAQARLAVRGFEELLQKLSAHTVPNSPLAANPMQAVMLQSGMGILQKLKEIAKIETEKDSGAPVHVFDLSIDPAGTILINGSDLKAFLAAGAPPPPAPPAEIPLQ